MTRAQLAQEREQEKERVLQQFTQLSDLSLSRFDEGQRWVLFAALHFLAFLGHLPPIKRFLAYFLAHSGMRLGTQVLSALLGVSDRALRYTQALSPKDLLFSLQHPRADAHRLPLLKPHHAGIVAQFLVLHPNAQSPQLLSFLRQRLGITLERKALHHFIEKYGLGCLRGDQIQEAPLF